MVILQLSSAYIVQNVLNMCKEESDVVILKLTSVYIANNVLK